MGSALFFLCLWPVAREWDDNMLPNDRNRGPAAEQEADDICLRDIANHLKAPGKMPVLAPWWFCPALAYWSEQPAVAGSSHESLPGIVDTARFYLTRDPEGALALVRSHGVKWVVAYDPQRVLDTSTTLLGATASPESLANRLYDRPSSAAPFLAFDYANPSFKLFRVRE